MRGESEDGVAFRSMPLLFAERGRRMKIEQVEEMSSRPARRYFTKPSSPTSFPFPAVPSWVFFLCLYVL